MDLWTQLDKWTAEYLPDLYMAQDEPMSRHTSFRVGGPARRMACPSNSEQLVLLLDKAIELGARPLVIGNGTNLLVSDRGLDRLVIDTTMGLNQITAGPSEHEITAESGASLARIADFACKQSLTGLEFAHGIPGTVGGGIYMNAGAYGGEMQQIIKSVLVLFPDEGVKNLENTQMSFAYRHSLLMDYPDAVALSATFCLKPGDPAKIREDMHDLMARRKASQPLDLPSAGSTFKRPKGGYYAAALIDQCGLKGLSVGAAQVSEKHAGFVINRGGATCTQICDLIAEIQRRVFEKTGVQLEPEVKIVE